MTATWARTGPIAYCHHRLNFAARPIGRAASRAESGRGGAREAPAPLTARAAEAPVARGMPVAAEFGAGNFENRGRQRVRGPWGGGRAGLATRRQEAATQSGRLRSSPAGDPQGGRLRGKAGPKRPAAVRPRTGTARARRRPAAPRRRRTRPRPARPAVLPAAAPTRRRRTGGSAPPPHAAPEPVSSFSQPPAVPKSPPGSAASLAGAEDPEPAPRARLMRRRARPGAELRDWTESLSAPAAPAAPGDDEEEEVPISIRSRWKRILRSEIKIKLE